MQRPEHQAEDVAPAGGSGARDVLVTVWETGVDDTMRLVSVPVTMPVTARAPSWLVNLVGVNVPANVPTPAIVWLMGAVAVVRGVAAAGAAVGAADGAAEAVAGARPMAPTVRMLTAAVHTFVDSFMVELLFVGVGSAPRERRSPLKRAAPGSDDAGESVAGGRSPRTGGATEHARAALPGPADRSEAQGPRHADGVAASGPGWVMS